jgi:predicted Zn-dependent protease
MRPRRRSGSGCLNVRLLIALGLAAFAVFSFLGSKIYNPVTGEEQYINITAEQEIALGLQAAPQMAQQFGGLHGSAEAQEIVDLVGETLVLSSVAANSEYPFEFHLLADESTVNAFALPGGQVFITAGLFGRLDTLDQLAGVLSHEIVHVIGRHGAERIAKEQLTQGLTGAVVLATYDPDDPGSQGTAQVALLVGQLINMNFGRADEIESDVLGVCLMLDAGYDPQEMIAVMRILDEATAGGRPPEFLSTHPDPGNRIARIKQSIADPSYCP